MEDIDHLLAKAENLRWITGRGTEQWMSEFRSRIKGLVHRRGADLRPHPKNPRRHPEAQIGAVRGVLNELGIAAALLIYVAGDGIETIIDGECRGKNFADTVWPCLLLDVTDEEAEYILATFDPLASQATTDAKALEELLAGLKIVSPEVQEMLEQLARESGIVLDDTPPVDAGKDFDEACANKVKFNECPKCHHKWPC